MDSFEPSAFGPLGGIITLAVLFVLRELTSGAIKEAGKELWIWARKQTAGQAGRRCRRTIRHPWAETHITLAAEAETRRDRDGSC